MKRKQTSTISALLTVISIFAVVATRPVNGQDTDPNDKTHLRARERDVVNLQSIGSYFYKVSRDGFVSQGIGNRYMVPAGRILVITDFTASFSGKQNTTPHVRLFQTDGGSVLFVWQRPEKIDSNGWGWLDSHWTGGLMVSARSGLFLQVVAESGTISNVFGVIAGYEVNASPNT